MRISELQGDSSVSGVTFTSGRVTCRFDDYQAGEYFISIPTESLYSEGSSESGTVHIRLIELKKVLLIEPNSQIYMAPAKFGAQMQMATQGFSLAVGLNSTDWPLFLQIRGYKILVACPIQSEESVRITRIE